MIVEKILSHRVRSRKNTPKLKKKEQKVEPPSNDVVKKESDTETDKTENKDVETKG